MSGPYEREIERLEDELDDSETEEDRRYILNEIREISREQAERDRWEEEGCERGWM